MKSISPLFGAIIGDVAGSFYEGRTPRNKDFKLFTKHSRFTDDTVMTLAVSDCIIQDVKDWDEMTKIYKDYVNRYPEVGYGDIFMEWVEHPYPRLSNGNGAAMRTSPVAWGCERQIRDYVAYYAQVSHLDYLAYQGAEIITTSILYAIEGVKNIYLALATKYPESFGYRLRRLSVEQHRDTRDKLSLDCSAKTTIPQAIAAFMESTDFESAIRNAIWIGGDTDTVASMAGAIAIAYYKSVPEWMYIETVNRLDPFLIDTINRFDEYLKNKNLSAKITVTS